MLVDSRGLKSHNFTVQVDYFTSAHTWFGQSNLIEQYLKIHASTLIMQVTSYGYWSTQLPR